MKPELGQWMTPAWAAEMLLERTFPHLSSADSILEPTCGTGAWLSAIPLGVPAIGCEIDPELAEIARQRSGRTVLTGDIRVMPIRVRPTVAIGNPPFGSAIVGQILMRTFDLLQPEGVAAYILPAYTFQTSRIVMQLSERWGLTVELLPRTLFPRLSLPLVWAQFRKSEKRVMVGFALYPESRAVEEMGPEVRRTLASGVRPPGTRSIWAAALDQAMNELGGEAGLDAIYETMAPRRPTANPFWQAKVRQVLQERYDRVGPARYARRRSLPAIAA